MSNFKDFITTFVGTYTPLGDGIANIDFEFIFAALVLLHLIIVFFKCIKFVFRRFGL